MKEQIELLLRGSRVARFHTTPTVKEETVGHHTSIVAGILLIVWPELMTVDILRHAIFHDSGEYITGDVPSPAKRLMDRTALDALESKVMSTHNMPLSPLSPEMKKIFKFADNLAGIATCVFELRIGNLHVAEAYINFTEYFRTSYDEGENGKRVLAAYKAIISQVPEHLIPTIEEVAYELKRKATR